MTTLIGLPVFLPFESKVSEIASQELTQVLASAKEQHFEVRVALIATPADLGAIPVLYRKPQRYADFLGQELVYYFKGVLLVVMPNGYGLYKARAKLPEDKKLLAELPPPGSTDGNALAVSAKNAVRVLAQRRGLTLRTAAVSSSSGNRGRVTLAAAVIALCLLALGGPARAGPPKEGSSRFALAH